MGFSVRQVRLICCCDWARDVASGAGCQFTFHKAKNLFWRLYFETPCPMNDFSSSLSLYLFASSASFSLRLIHLLLSLLSSASPNLSRSFSRLLPVSWVAFSFIPLPPPIYTVDSNINSFSVRPSDIIDRI